MTMRFDRVLRKGYEDDTLVYSLVLDDLGLYVIRTGNVGGLASGESDVNINSDDASDPTFVRQLTEQEARLESEALPVLTHSPYSAYVPLQQVTGVEVDAEAEPPMLTLDTVGEHYEFAFTHDSAEQVSALAEALRARLQT